MIGTPSPRGAAIVSVIAVNLSSNDTKRSSPSSCSKSLITSITTSASAVSNSNRSFIGPDAEKPRPLRLPPHASTTYRAACSLTPLRNLPPVAIFGQQLVGCLFLVERLAEDIGCIVEVEIVGERRRGPVRRDLVVLDPLRRRDQRRVLGHRLTRRLDDLRAFLDQALHAGAHLTGPGNARRRKQILDPLRVAARLGEVLLERLPKLLRTGGACAIFGSASTSCSSALRRSFSCSANTSCKDPNPIRNPSPRMTDVLSCYPVHRAQTPPVPAPGVVDPTDPTTAYAVELFRPDTQGGTQRVEGPRRLFPSGLLRPRRSAGAARPARSSGSRRRRSCLFRREGERCFRLTRPNPL